MRRGVLSPFRCTVRITARFWSAPVLRRFGGFRGCESRRGRPRAQTLPRPRETSAIQGSNARHGFGGYRLPKKVTEKMSDVSHRVLRSFLIFSFVAALCVATNLRAELPSAEAIAQVVEDYLARRP